MRKEKNVNLVKNTSASEIKIETAVKEAFESLGSNATVKYFESPEAMMADKRSHDLIVPVRINEHSAYIAIDGLNPHFSVLASADGSLIVIDIFSDFPSEAQ